MEDHEDREATMAIQPPALGQHVTSGQHATPNVPSSSGEKPRQMMVNLPWEMKLAIFQSISSVEDAQSLAATCKAMAAVFGQAQEPIAFALVVNGLGDPGLARVALAYFNAQDLGRWACADPTANHRSDGSWTEARPCPACRLRRIEAMEAWSRSLRPRRICLRYPPHGGVMKVAARILAHHAKLRRLVECVAIYGRYGPLYEGVARPWKLDTGRGLSPEHMDAAFGPRQLTAMFYAYDILQILLHIDPFGYQLVLRAPKRQIDRDIDAWEYPGASEQVDKFLNLMKELDERTDFSNSLFCFENLLLGAAYTGRLGLWSGPPKTLRWPPICSFVFRTAIRDQMRVGGTVSLCDILGFQVPELRWHLRNIR